MKRALVPLLSAAVVLAGASVVAQSQMLPPPQSTTTPALPAAPLNSAPTPTATPSPGKATQKPIDDYSLNTRPALGSAGNQQRGVLPNGQRNGVIGSGIGAYGNGNLLNPNLPYRDGLGRPTGGTTPYGLDGSGAFVSPNQFGGAVANPTGVGVPNGGRPSHMDARGTQRVN